jgi:hypothetical protein
MSQAEEETPSKALATSARLLELSAKDLAERAANEKAGAKKDALNARSKELSDFAIEAGDILRRFRMGQPDDEE